MSEYPIGLMLGPDDVLHGGPTLWDAAPEPERLERSQPTGLRIPDGGKDRVPAMEDPAPRSNPVPATNQRRAGRAGPFFFLGPVTTRGTT